MTEYRKYWNERMETLSSEAYREVQSKALVKEMEYVWQNSTLYQEKFKKAYCSRFWCSKWISI